MKHRILGFINGGRRRRLTLLVGVVGALAGLAAFMISNALAVHELQFQLDGNTNTECGTVPKCETQKYDWDSLFNANGTTTSLVNPVTGPFTAASFVRDFGVKVSNSEPCSLTNTTSKTFCTADSTTYATGSKDTLNITGGWECNKDNNVNSKIDIMNAYAASYIDPSSGHKILYFGLDKNKDNGNNDVGFWFLQGEANCASGASNTPWTGSHHDGDVLVVSEFTSGGGVSSIAAYRWAGGATGCIDSKDNPNPKTGGCNGEPIGNGGDCKKVTSGTTDAICATTNSGTLAFNKNIETKWLTSDATLGVGHTVVPPNFFEGGIDITEVFEKAGGTAPSCFNTFVGDTRSSQSLTATLFDYARGVLGECKTELATKAGDTANGGSASPSDIGAGKVSSGTDTSTLTVTGTKVWGGTLSWYLCGPVSADACERSKGVQVTSRAVSNSSPASDFVSGTAELTSVGRYCWTAHFAPNAESEAAGVKAADDNGANECFTVKPVKPTLTTAASCSASPCVLGSTLSDKATLGGTAKQPGTNGGNSNYPSINATNGEPAGHNISWVLYSPKSGGCSESKATSPTSVAVKGNGEYGPTSYTTKVSDGIGTYTFVASYPGDGAGSNTEAATSTGCPDTSGTETVEVVGEAEFASEQRWMPNDKVIVKGQANLNGKLTVTLFPTENCTGTPVSGQKYEETLSEATSPHVFNTSNSSFSVEAGSAGHYSWLVKYKDENLTTKVTEHCEKSTVSITD